ncbi:hypothetical protein DRO32_00675 [Candidatus Bathyarchaeota archaeon]|nr:MAG: hypothetical protein DRO32_00675 [Candidatus Bathyarchaeota archaeon]
MKAIDFHLHPLPMLPDRLLTDEVEAACLEKCVLLAMDVDPGALEEPWIRYRMASTLFDEGFWDLYGLDHARLLLQLGRTPNTRVAELVAERPDVFVGGGSVNPSRGLAYVEEKLAEVRELGLSGVKIIPTLQFLDPERHGEELEAIFDFCSKEKLVLILHTGCDPGPWELPALSANARPSLYGDLIGRYPDVPVVLAHAGSYSLRQPGIWLDEALALCRENDNVWLDLAAVTYLAVEEKFVVKIRNSVGFDRFLFGSDWPTVQGVSVKDAIGRVEASRALGEHEKEAILRGNARELLSRIRVPANSG